MAKIDAQEKTILEYLSKNKFLIPLYQRPYTWEQEQCEELWNDIVDFFIENKDFIFNNDDKKYFLGSIVLYEDKCKQNIIDGQQRTTTLSLLICALYDKAFNQHNPAIAGLVSSLAACLWDADKIAGTVDYSKFHLESEVAIDEDNKKLHSILSYNYKIPKNVNIDALIKKAESNYEKNYLFFIKKSDEFAKEYPPDWEKLCIVILNNCIVLPLECQGNNENDRFDNALRIFNTLNNRGIPLSDADIFKGEIIKNKKAKEEREIFINDWKELEEQIDMQFLFVQYTHVLRARDENSSKEIGLRKFYTTSKYKDKLNDSKVMEEIMEEIKELASFWLGYYDKNLSLHAKQMFDVLKFYPNEYWKALVSAYYFYCRDKEIDFFNDDTLLPFLQKSIANLLIKYINKATVNTIKDPVFNAYVSLYKNDNGKIDFKTDSKEIINNDTTFKLDFFKANKLISSLITLNLYIKYSEQEIINDRQIEHIFPKTTMWRKSYTGWDKEEAKPYIESIGNKMLLEERLNIWASNKYFDEKIEEYEKSKILEAQDLAKYPKGDWLKEDIENRNEEIYERLLEFFKENV